MVPLCRAIHQSEKPRTSFNRYFNQHDGNGTDLWSTVPESVPTLRASLLPALVDTSPEEAASTTWHVGGFQIEANSYVSAV